MATPPERSLSRGLEMRRTLTNQQLEELDRRTQRCYDDAATRARWRSLDQCSSLLRPTKSRAWALLSPIAVVAQAGRRPNQEGETFGMGYIGPESTNSIILDKHAPSIQGSMSHSFRQSGTQVPRCNAVIPHRDLASAAADSARYQQALTAGGHGHSTGQSSFDRQRLR
jgi:hypothetical protein